MMSSAHAEITIDPASIDLALEPGETLIETQTVTIPGGDSGIAVDIYFLAETTGSMSSVINQVKADAELILADLASFLVDVQFGVGEYKDFPSDPFAFRHNTSITDVEADILAGIDLWVASGGFDVSEGQLFGLDRIADPSDP